MATETIWTALTGADLGDVLSSEVLATLDEAVGATPGAPLDPSDTASLRSYRIVAAAVAELRDAVRNGGRYPVSVEAGTVPPMSKPHVLNMAKWRLVNSKPSLAQALMDKMPELNREFQWAKEHFDFILKGGSVALPSYPAGADYLTAVSADNPAVSGVDWGDLYGTADEYEAGEGTDDNGNVITLPVNSVEQS